jgi:hypothetical protein
MRADEGEDARKLGLAIGKHNRAVRGAVHVPDEIRELGADI